MFQDPLLLDPLSRCWGRVGEDAGNEFGFPLEIPSTIMEGGARKISQNPPVSQNLLGFGSLKILQYLIYPEELRVPSQIFRSLSATLFEGGALIS